MYFAYCSNERLVLMSFKVRVREERMGCGMLNQAGACYKRVCCDVGVGGRLIEGGY